MKLKLDAEGKPEIRDGHPVYIGDDGAESVVDVAKLTADVASANGQARDRRLELDQAKAKLRLFGDLDPSKAREAIAFREALGDDIDPSKVQNEIASLKAEKAGLTTQVEELSNKVHTADETIDNLSLGAQISGSEFVRTKVVSALQDPARFRAAYGDHLSRDDKGNVIVKDAAGNTVMSEKHAGQPATLDEALPRIVTDKRDLVPQGAGGTGDKSDTTADGSTVKTGKLSEMNREDKAAALRKHVVGGGNLESFMATG